eukprot:417384-Pelagomonas_calceolata.AAC.1
MHCYVAHIHTKNAHVLHKQYATVHRNLAYIAKNAHVMRGVQHMLQGRFSLRARHAERIRRGDAMPLNTGCMCYRKLSVLNPYCTLGPYFSGTGYKQPKWSGLDLLEFDLQDPLGTAATIPSAAFGLCWEFISLALVHLFCWAPVALYWLCACALMSVDVCWRDAARPEVPLMHELSSFSLFSKMQLPN